MNPVLIYRGVNVCYDMLNYMADQLGKALGDLGFEVIYYDVENEGLGGISQFVGREFSAVIGFQTYAFDVFLPSKNCNLHDLIIGPKYNFIFDHPIWMKDHLINPPKDYYVLTHDRNYIEFIKEHYKKVTDALLLPPGGTVQENGMQECPKSQNIIFLGTYNNYREMFPVIRNSSKSMRRIANAYLLELRKHHDKAPERVLEGLLKEEGRTVDEEEFLSLLDSIKSMISLVTAYYREKVIRAILEADIQLVVYGKSWKDSPFADCPNLIINPEVSPDESLKEYSASKLSLNIMTWHKDGFTERIANSMLHKSVVISDVTTTLVEQYKDGEDIILFDLDEIDDLPHRIKELLKDDGKIARISDNAYNRAIAEDTWGERAKLLLYYMQQ